MERENKQKRVMITLAIILLLFVVTTVYAIGNGIITIWGETYFQSNVDVVFWNPSISNMTSGESVIVSLDGHTLSMKVVMPNPGEIRTVDFYIKNIGNRDVKLDEIIPMLIPSASSVNYPNISNVIVPISDVRGPYTISITWDNNPDQEETEYFSAELNFTQNIS